MRKPWFPFYAADWLCDLDVMSMTLAERGAYMHLLTIQWREGFIPNSEATVYRLLGLCFGSRLIDPDNQGLFELTNVLNMFEVDPENPDKLKNKRLEIIRSEADTISEQRAIAGKKGGKQKRSKSEANIEAKSSYSQSQSHTQLQEEQKEPSLTSSTGPSLKIVPSFDLLSAYEAYPRHEGKAGGLKKAKTRIKTQADFDRLMLAIENYKQSDTVKNGFVMIFSTFMGGRWEDYIAGPVVVGKPKHTTYNGKIVGMAEVERPLVTEDIKL